MGVPYHGKRHHLDLEIGSFQYGGQERVPIRQDDFAYGFALRIIVPSIM